MGISNAAKIAKALARGGAGFAVSAAAIGGSYTATDSLAEQWHPELSNSQLNAYYDERPIVEMDGERGSGKTLDAVHKLVRHCYLNNNSAAVIFVVVKSSGDRGGAWEKLNSLERDSEGRPSGVLEYWRDHVGLQATPPRIDNHKNEYVELTNKYGNIVRIDFRSLPPGETIEGRLKGLEPSFALIDEYNETPNAVKLITKLMQQIGRRKGVQRRNTNGEWESAPQQLVLCANPPYSGPDDPCFKFLFRDIPILKKCAPIAEARGDCGVFVRNDDPYIGRWHILMDENIWMDNKEQYLENVRIETANDPSAEDRLIRGIWRKKLEGVGIFKHYWKPDIHIKPAPGDPSPALAGLRPVKPDPIIIGYDSGDANNARIFMQCNRVKGGRIIWRIFDEIVDTETHLSIETKARAIMDRRNKWIRAIGYNFAFRDISDRQAMVAYNEMGGFEYKMYEKISTRLISEHPEFSGMTPIRMEAPGKGPGSVAERVKILHNLLLTESIWVSRTCVRVIDMFAQLKKEKGRNGVENEFHPARSQHLHVFDAVTYPILFYEQNDLMDADYTRDENSLASFTLSI